MWAVAMRIMTMRPVPMWAMVVVLVVVEITRRMDLTNDEHKEQKQLEHIAERICAWNACVARTGDASKQVYSADAIWA